MAGKTVKLETDILATYSENGVVVTGPATIRHMSATFLPGTAIMIDPPVKIINIEGEKGGHSFSVSARYPDPHITVHR